MTDIIFQGGMTALVDGSLEGTPDIRLALVTASFTAEVDAVNLADFATLGEFTAVGYQRYDCDNPAFAYDAGDDEYQLTFDAGEFNASGMTVAPGPYDAEGILVILHVDGTEANDIAIGYTDSGGFPINGVNTAITITPPADGLMFLAAA